jgi:hypothetical protein
MLLVVAAFWVEGTDTQDTLNEERRIKGSGAVVTFTPEQANQPGLRRHLRQFNLDEAADWEPGS